MRTVIWKLERVVSRANGVITEVESIEDARKSGNEYVQKLMDEGETILDVKEEGNKLVITLQ